MRGSAASLQLLNIVLVPLPPPSPPPPGIPDMIQINISGHTVPGPDFPKPKKVVKTGRPKPCLFYKIRLAVDILASSILKREPSLIAKDYYLGHYPGLTM